MENKVILRVGDLVKIRSVISDKIRHTRLIDPDTILPIKYMNVNGYHIGVIMEIEEEICKVRINADLPLLVIETHRIDKLNLEGYPIVSYTAFKNFELKGYVVLGNELFFYDSWEGVTHLQKWIPKGIVQHHHINTFPRVVTDEEFKLRTVSEKFGI